MPRTASSTLTTSSIDLPTGVTLSYVEQGSSSGVPVVLLHGISDSLRSFDPVLPHLPDTMRAFALSQRGHGDSSRPERPYAPADFAADVAAFLDSMSVSRAVITGHSMGSLVAEQFAASYPDRTLGLVLLGAFATVAGNPTWVDLRRAVADLGEPVDRGFLAEFQASTLARPIPEEFLDLVVQESMKLPARVWQAITQDFLAAPAIELRAIRTPTLVLWGDQDAYCSRAEQVALLTNIETADLVRYAGTGHALHWEEPARFAKDLAAFVASLR